MTRNLPFPRLFLEIWSMILESLTNFRRSLRIPAAPIFSVTSVTSVASHDHKIFDQFSVTIGPKKKGAEAPLFPGYYSSISARGKYRFPSTSMKSPQVYNHLRWLIISVLSAYPALNASWMTSPTVETGLTLRTNSNSFQAREFGLHGLWELITLICASRLKFLHFFHATLCLTIALGAIGMFVG